MSAQLIDLLRILAIGLLGLVLWTGCTDTESTPDGPNSGAAAPKDPDNYSSSVESETWNVCHALGVRIGHRHIQVRVETQSGKEILRIIDSTEMFVLRFGQEVRTRVKVESLETPDGQLIEMRSAVPTGSGMACTVARVVDGQLGVEVTTMGKTSRSSIPWSSTDRGPDASRATLLRSPMEPGQHRELRIWDPMTNQLVTLTMTAGDVETIDLLGRKRELLRIDTVLDRADGARFPGTIWCDRAGVTWKEYAAAMEMEAYRTTKDVALAQKDMATLDLGLAMMIPLGRELPKPHETKRIVYRVEFSGGDPVARFKPGPSQRATSIEPGVAEVTVWALRPGQEGGNVEADPDPPSEKDLLSNNLIQSDYPKIVAMAREVVGEETDPWKIACLLEQHVHQYIESKDYSQAIGTAAEVAENPVGDCTEHAVLLAALARARRIPARVAVGLLYMRGRQALGYHMWTEVFIGKRWIPIDATLGNGGIGAAHLKLSHSNLEGVSPFEVLAPIAQVMGNLKVEIVEVE